MQHMKTTYKSSFESQLFWKCSNVVLTFKEIVILVLSTRHDFNLLTGLIRTPCFQILRRCALLENHKVLLYLLQSQKNFVCETHQLITSASLRASCVKDCQNQK